MSSIEGEDDRPPPPFSSLLVPSQPTKLHLPFFTPGEDYEQKVIAARRLHATQPIDQPSNLPSYSQEDINNLRQRVWKVLQDRLTKHGISLAGLNQRFFSWLLPKNNASVQDWDAFLSNPLLVDTETLKQLFFLEQSTADSRQDLNKNHLVYIRTFAFTVEGLIEVLQELLNDEVPHDIIKSLLESIHGLANNQVVYVRYAGQTTHGSAYKRHYKDLIQRQPSFMTKFLQAVLRTTPEVIEAAEVHEVMDATVVNFPYYDRDLANKREQALIALLNKTFSVNIQVGGTWSSTRPYKPTDEDATDFNALRTTLLDEMNNKCTPCSDELVSQISDYTKRVQAYTVNNTETTGSANFPITENVRSMLCDQAIPTMLGKYAVMVTIGSDLTPDAVSGASSFYGGNVESGSLCSSGFNQLGSWELGQYTKIQAITAQLQKTNHLPFVDFYPWTKKTDSDFPFALATLRSYLQNTKPIILLTFSHKVSSAAVGSFQHPHGIKNAEFADMVGQLILSKYDETPGSREDDNCAIVIPCYHPGVVGYGSASPETYMQIISQVLVVVWLAMDRVIKLSSLQRLNKKELCQRICLEVKAIVGPGTKFGTALTKLKETLKSITKQVSKASDRQHLTFTTRHQALNPGRQAMAESGFTFAYDGDTLSLTNSRTRWAAAKNELYQVMACEIATPRAQRKEQIDRLDGMALPFLQHDEYEFRKFAVTVSEGRSYYIEISDRARRLREVPNLLSVHLPSEYNPNSSTWKEDNAAVKKADDNLVDWLKIAIINPSTSSESAVDRCAPAFSKLLRLKYESLAKSLRMDVRRVIIPRSTGDSLQGAQVLVRPRNDIMSTTGDLELTWNCNGTEYKLNNFSLPGGVAPVDLDDKRFIYFVPGGIDIRDSSGHTLGVSSGRSTTVSLSMIHTILRKEVSLEPFLALWEKETNLKVDDQLFGPVQTVSAGATLIYPASYFRGTGTPWDSSRARKATKLAQLQASKPIQPEDVVWLVHKFLLEHYPNIGDVVDSGNPTIWPSPESDTVWPKLQMFLSSHKYRNHPQRANLTSAAQNASDPRSQSIVTLESVLTCLRGTVQVKTVRTCKGGPDRIKKLFTIQGVAPPDLLDPNRPEPALVPYSTAQSIEDQGLEVVEDDEEEDQEGDELDDAQAGSSTIRVGRNTGVSGDNDEDEDGEMLLQPDAPQSPYEPERARLLSAFTTKPSMASKPKLATDQASDQPMPHSSISHVSQSTVGEKRRRRFSGEGKGKGKKARQESDDEMSDDVVG